MNTSLHFSTVLVQEAHAAEFELAARRANRIVARAEMSLLQRIAKRLSAATKRSTHRAPTRVQLSS